MRDFHNTGATRNGFEVQIHFTSFKKKKYSHLLKVNDKEGNDFFCYDIYTNRFISILKSYRKEDLF